MRKLSLSYLTAPVQSPLEAISIAARAGYDHLGLRLRDPQTGRPASDLVGSRALLAETHARLADTGLTVLEVEAWALIAGKGHICADAVFETTAVLGNPRLIVVADRAGQIELGEICDQFAALAEAASRYGLCVDFEPIAHRAAGNLSDGLAVVNAGKQWGAGLTLDALHIDRMGLTPDELRSIDPQILHILHLCDAPPRPGDLETMIDHSARNRLVPGEGALPLRDYLAALPDNLPLALEIPMERLGSEMSLEDRAHWPIKASRAFLKIG